jgi:ATP-binding cassette subfamily B protein
MTHFLRRIIFDYFRPYRKQVWLMFLCIASLIVFDTLFPLGTTFLIDRAITPHNIQMLILIAVSLVGLFILSSFGSLGADYLTAWLQAHVTNDMRMQMFSHLQSLPASYYTHLQYGDVITRFNTDVAAIEYALAYSVITGIQSVVQLIMSVVVLIMLDVQLGILTIIVLSLTVVFPKRLVDRASKLMGERRVLESNITSTVQDNLQAHAVNRAFGLRDLAISAFTSQLNRFAKVATRSAYTDWLVNRVTNMGQYVIQLLVIIAGGYLVFTGRLSVGSWVGFTGVLINVGYAVALVSVAWAGLIPAVTSLKRIEDLLNEKIQIKDNLDAALPRFTRDICFEQVTFSYTGVDGKPNLNQVNFCIPSGQSVAIIGRSGSGKSTILNLLMRFYDPQTGRVLVDGHNIQQVSLASLRSQMGVVFQDSFLFNISLRENIRLGKIGASDAEVEAAARGAGIHDTILGLPAGYETLAGEQGKVLSGGQRQRICLARAIVRRPAILLLDEATSALDPETENLIYETLGKLKHTCTIISVTHRLAPIADSDQIVVMDQGKVMEAGRHNALLSRAGLYYQLYTQQNGFTVSPDGQHAEVTPDRLQNIPLFARLDDLSSKQIAAQFVSERFESGQLVIEEGAPGDKFYVVVRGKLKVTVIGNEQRPVHVGVLQDGDYFGEIALLEGSRRTATVRAILPTLCLTLERKLFLSMMAANPAVRSAIENTKRDRLSVLRNRFSQPG